MHETYFSSHFYDDNISKAKQYKENEFDSTKHSHLHAHMQASSVSGKIHPKGKQVCILLINIKYVSQHVREALTAFPLIDFLRSGWSINTAVEYLHLMKDKQAFNHEVAFLTRSVRGNRLFLNPSTENFKRTVHWCIDKCEHNKYSCMERGHGRANGVPPCHTTGTTTVQPPTPSVLPSSVIAEAALETFSSQAGTAIRRNNSGAGSLNSLTSHTHAAFTSKTDHGQRTSLASICKISHDNEQTTAAYCAIPFEFQNTRVTIQMHN
uniref:Uncharacterized protein n=1 Tax=Glossina pallidipes TaxID=7398 RepID=A0A1B0AE51_GLOPL